MSDLRLAIKNKDLDFCLHYFKTNYDNNIDEKLFNSILSILILNFNIINNHDLINIFKYINSSVEYKYPASYSLNIDFMCKYEKYNEAIYILLKYLENNELKYRYVSPFFSKLKDTRLDFVVSIFKIIEKNELKITYSDISYLYKSFINEINLLHQLTEYTIKHYLIFDSILIDLFSSVYTLIPTTISNVNCQNCQ